MAEIALPFLALSGLFIFSNRNNDSSKDKQSKDNIFYYLGEPYFIEGVSYIPEENYNYSEIGLSSFYGKELHNIKTVNNQIHVLNAPSPGATSSLSIADYIIDKYFK